MTSEQMAWGLATFLTACLVRFVWREITQSDNLWATIHQNRRQAEEALEESRKEFAASLNQIAGQFRASLEPLNTTVAGLASAIGKLEATMAREYATKSDLRDLREDLNKGLEQLRQSNH
jgi:chromosome segregation ATPase